MKKILLFVMIFLMVLSMFSICIHHTHALETIYIRADGSIDPPTAPISTVDNVTYTLTDNVNESIIVERDNIVVDGAGYTVQGTGSGEGFRWWVNNVTIKNTKIKGFEHGIEVVTSNNYNNVISGNKITDNLYGIRLVYSSNNSIFGNNITNNGYGLQFQQSNNNTISGNNIMNSVYCGINFWSSCYYNTISGNNITANSWFGGIYLSYVSSNSIYHNNFINNVPQTKTDAYVNTWDFGYPSGGNYWSDYTGNDTHSGPYQNLTGSDGIGDTPYVINENNQDNYPLMKPYPWDPHDIGITCIEVSKTNVGQNFTLDISVAIFNYGDYLENFDLEVYANTSMIYTTSNIIVASETCEIIVFSWNTSGFDMGNYSLIAGVSVVPSEIDTSDNSLVEGWAFISIPGDTDGDKDVDIYDIVMMADIYGVSEPDPLYNPNCDIDGDGDIDIYDIVIAADNYGESW